MAISDKLTYLNTTKTKIREGLNSLGADLDTEDTFRSYADAIEGIYEDYPKITGEGESLSLDNTKQASMKIDYKGQTSQTTYSGKNILDLTSFTTTTQSGITLTPTFNGSELLYITSSGIFSSTTYILLTDTLTIQPSTSYTLSGGYNASSRLRLREYDSSNTQLSEYFDSGRGVSFTSKSNVHHVNIQAVFYAQNNVKFYPMLRLSSVSDATYEPYVGGTASPNPSFPQNVNVVSGDNTINVCGKNLFDIQKMVKGRLDNGVINYPDNTTSLTLNETSFSFTTNNNYRGVVLDYTNIGNETNITFNSSSSRDGNSYKVACYDSDKNYLGDATFTTPTNYTILYTLLTNTKFIRMHILLNSVGSTTITNPMLLKGHYTSETIPTYEPYIGNSYPIYLGVENLLNRSLCTENRFLIWTSGLLQSDTGSLVSDYIKVDINQNYAFNYVAQVLFYDSSKTYIGALATDGTSINKDSSIGFSAIKVPNNNEVVYMRLGFRTSYNNNLDMTQQDIIVNKGSMASHVSTTPIELCKIGDYQDYFYKENKKWYKYNAIGKKVLKGSEVWSYNSVTQGSLFRGTNTITNHLKDATYSPYSDYYKGIPANNVTNRQNNQFYIQTNFNYLDIIDNRYTNSDDFKNWLSSNNVSIYYILATPTNTLIEDTTLLEQLEESKLSYISQTNISQENNDLPFNLDVKALRGE